MTRSHRGVRGALAIGLAAVLVAACGSNGSTEGAGDESGTGTTQESSQQSTETGESSQSGESTETGTFNAATYDGQDRQQKLEQCSKDAGGSMTFYGQLLAPAQDQLIKAFTTKYPWTQVDNIRKSGTVLVQQMLNELQAGQVKGDVAEGTIAGSASAKAAGVLQPFTTPVLDDYPEQYVDPDHFWAPDFSYFGDFMYNTDLVSGENVPKTYEDLLKPFWKGKIAFGSDPGNSGPAFITMLRDAWGEEKADEYLKKFAAQNPVNAGKTTSSLEQTVISGQYAGVFPALAHHIAKDAKKGAPVKAAFLKPVIYQVSAVGLVKDAPHPCTAMLFIDFLLGKDGAQVMADQAGYIPVNPNVKLNPDLASVVPPESDQHFMSPEKMAAGQKSSVEFYTKTFAK